MTTAGPRRWFFDAWARIYDVPWVQRSTYRPVHDAVVEALGDRRQRRLLDLGCGTGQLAARLARALPRVRVVGCDFSAGMLGQAAARCPGTRLVQGDAGRLPFAPGVFDVVVCTEAFHWFPHPAAALAECFRVLRPGGHLLLAVVTPPAQPVSELFHLGSRLLGEPFYWPSGAQTRQWVTAAGFRIIRQARVPRYGDLLLPPVLTDAVRPARRSGPRMQDGGKRMKDGGKRTEKQTTVSSLRSSVLNPRSSAVREARRIPL